MSHYEKKGHNEYYNLIFSYESFSSSVLWTTRCLSTHRCDVEELILEIEKNHAFEMEMKNSKYCVTDSQYDVTDSDILALKKSLTSQSYKFSPLSLNNSVYFFCYHPNDYYHRFYISSFVDKLVLNSLYVIIVREFNLKKDYFSKKTLSIVDHTSEELLAKFQLLMKEWKGLDELLIIDGYQNISSLNRLRVLEKVRPIIQNDEDLYQILKSYCYYTYIDEENGEECSSLEGLPPIDGISELLLHLFYDDFDQEMEEKFPNLPYVRCGGLFFFPINEKTGELVRESEIFTQIIKNHIPIHDAHVVSKGGRPFSISGICLIRINDEGMCEIKIQQEFYE